MFQLVDKELHGIDRAHLHQNTAKHPHLCKRTLIDQKLFLAGAGSCDVDGWEGPLIRQFAIQDNLAVAGTLEFLKDHLVHPGPRFDQCRGDDRQ